MNEYEWVQFAIALAPWIGVAFAAGYGLRLLQFGRAPVAAVPLPEAPLSEAAPLPEAPLPEAAPLPDSTADPDPLAYATLVIQERFKSGFLARTAHELRAPINSMVGLHQLILEDLCESPAEEREFIEQARDSAMKLLQRLDTLIAASKLDSGREPPKLTPLSVAELLQVVENLTLLQAANHNLRLTVTLPEDTVSVQADGRWLRSLLVGLMEDTINHTPSGFVKLWCEPDTQTSTAQTSTIDPAPAPGQLAVCIASDRPVESLTQTLHAIQTSGEIEAQGEAQGEAEAGPDAERSDATSPSPGDVVNRPPLPPIYLSTGLVLSTAQLMLPPMAGQITVLPGPEGSGSIIKVLLPNAPA